MEKGLLEKLPVLRIVKKFPKCTEPKGSLLEPGQSSPHPTILRPILILSLHVHLGLASGFYP
jgi:hypothetical protein